MKQELNILKNENDIPTEITAEIEVVGPGRMLKEARILRGLSHQQIAENLNFRMRLVQDIEIDKFDHSIPEAFNRGYLKSYAQLVNISQEDVLNSYDKLAVAQRQVAGMQSFSKGTTKQAEHNMLMWITYLILAILITSTVVWWWQTPSEQPEPIVIDKVEILAAKNTTAEQVSLSSENSSQDLSAVQNGESVISSVKVIKVEANANTNDNAKVENLDKMLTHDAEGMSLKQNLIVPQVGLSNEKEISKKELPASIANVIFTFSGDCWVNISDASGERIAWGVKKSGYIMRISGQSPFSITLGRPELVKIAYNDVPVDLAAFNPGNIAKFSLPLVP